MNKLLKRSFVSILTLALSFQAAFALETFTDVSSTNPNYEAIMGLKSRGVISGYPDGSFQPDRLVNRVEALKIILESAKININDASTEKSFSDVSGNQWYIKYLNKAKALGIVSGYSDGTFQPAKTVNLVENLKMTLLSHNISVESLIVNEDPFSDGPKGQWYSQYLQYAKTKKILEGDTLSKIYPDKGMTRGKIAEMVYRLMVIKENNLDFYGQVKTDPVKPTNPTTPATGTTVDPDAPFVEYIPIEIKNMKFAFEEPIVGKGWRVIWTNNDTTAHTIVEDTGLFTSKTLNPGDSFEFIFQNEGTYSYHCGLHPSIKAKIIVKPPQQVPTI